MSKFYHNKELSRSSQLDKSASALTDGDVNHCDRSQQIKGLPLPILGNEVLREKGWERVTYYINPRYGDVRFTRAEALRFEGREYLLTIAERAEKENKDD